MHFGARLAVAKVGAACMHVPADGYLPRSVRKHAQAGATIKRLQLRLKGGGDGNPGLEVTEYGVVSMTEGVGRYGGKSNRPPSLPYGPWPRNHTRDHAWIPQ